MNLRDVARLLAACAADLRDIRTDLNIAANYLTSAQARLDQQGPRTPTRILYP